MSSASTRATLQAILWKSSTVSLWLFVIDSSLSHLLIMLGLDSRTAFSPLLWLKALWLTLAFGLVSGLCSCLLALSLLRDQHGSPFVRRLPAWSLATLLVAGLFGPRLPFLDELPGILLLLTLLSGTIALLEHWLSKHETTVLHDLSARTLLWSLLLISLSLPKLNAHLLPGSPVSAKNAPLNLALLAALLGLGLLSAWGWQALSRLRERVWIQEARPSLSSLDRRLLQSLGFGYALGILGTAAFPPGISVEAPSESLRTTHPTAYATGTRPPDLLLIVVDTLRADRLGLYGSQNPTPRLDAFAQESLVFEQQQSASPWTLPAMASLFTGKSPSAHGAAVVSASDGTARRAMLGVLPVREDLTTLGLELQKHGYRTGLIGTNPCLDRSLGLGRGIEYHALLLRSGLHYSVLGLLLEPLGLRPLDPVDTTLSAQELLPHFERFFAQTDARPAALIAHLMDPHWPYHPPEQAPAAERQRLQATLAGWSSAYDVEVQRVDTALGALLDQLQAQGRLDKLVVALTADHGEAFGEHGTWFKPEQKPAGSDVYEARQSLHGHSVFQELLHVPFLLRGPGLAPGRVSSVTRGVDVMPTLLAALGLPIPEGLEGVNLLSLPPASAASDAPRVSPSPALSESVLLGEERKSWREGHWKLIVGPWRAGAGPAQLFDLAADPQEQHELSAQEPARVMRMRAALVEHVQQLAAGVDPTRPLDPETLEKLRALGYVHDEPHSNP